jgi:DNA-binding transcriptional LysR family regulator
MIQSEIHLSLRALRLVDAIAREGHLSGAGAALGLTQSAVTKALQEAEASCGLPLFIRTNRGAIPTAYGAALVAHARVVLAQMRQATQELADLRDGSAGRVSVGTLVSASVALLPRTIARVQRDRPGMAISVIEGTNDTLMPLLRQGDLDLVVGRLPEFRARDGIAQEVLGHDHAEIVCAPDHPLVGRGGLGLSDLLACRWILPRAETTLRRQIDSAFRAQGLAPPAHAVESVSILANRALIREFGYLAVWPVQLARAEEALHQIARLPLALPETARPLGISTRANARLSPAAETLLAALRQNA